MKVRVDDQRCQGHGVCHMTAPAVFHLAEEDGHSYVLSPDVPAELEEDAARGTAACPELAITIE